MEFSLSSSVSSSSTTTTPFSENFCRSKGNAFGCLSGVLSRIFCSKNLPTFPVEGYNHQQMFKVDKIEDSSTTPNLVARLMGLDSMPEIDNSITITRSKSMNSMDFKGKTEEIQEEYKREKTSFSFRETPDYFELQDDDFYIISFENTKKGSNLGNSEVGSKGNKHKGKRGKCLKKQRRRKDEQIEDRVFSDEERLSLKFSNQNFCNNDIVRNQSYHLSPLRDKTNSSQEEIERIKARKKKKKASCLPESKEEDEEEECDSENSSPVSVLDYSEFISDPEVTTSGEEARRDIVSRDLSCDESNGSSMGDEREREGNEERSFGLKRKDFRKQENIEICRLAGLEMNNSNWKYRGMPMVVTEELEDVGIQFGQHIFDQLVCELLDQLLGLQCQDF